MRRNWDKPFSKQIMKRKQFLEESGVSATELYRELHGAYAKDFAKKISPDKTRSAYMIDTGAFISLWEDEKIFKRY